MWYCTGPCGSQGMERGQPPPYRVTPRVGVSPRNALPREGRRCPPRLQQSPATPNPAAGCAAREPSSPRALPHFQRHKKPLGSQLYPYLSAVISCCRFSSKPTASCSHAPASGHHHLTSTSSPSTQESSWQLTRRRVTPSLGWSLFFTQRGLTPVGVGILTRA